MPDSVQGKTEPWARPILAIAVILAGLSAGFFATYQYSITTALATVSDPVYVETFQAINATIRNATFGVIFFGTLPALLIVTWLYRRVPQVRLWLVCALIGYGLTLAITFVFHIPLNDQLAVVDVTQEATQARGWFEAPWNEMHLMRTLTVCIAFVLTVVALLQDNRR